MATAQTAQSVAPNQLGQLQSLLTLLTGSKTTSTSNPGDVTALQQLLAQLQGADYSGLLEGIFNQAGAQIPGMQVALSNSMGARTGNNSAMSAALQQLMKQTALEGQKQVVQQQLQNQQIQAQAGGAVASATKGTTQTQGEKGKLGEIAGLVGLLQGALKLTGSKDMGDLFGKLSGTATPAGSSGSFNPSAQSMAVGTAPLMQGNQQVGNAVWAPGNQQVYSEAMPTANMAMPSFDAGQSFDANSWEQDLANWQPAANQSEVYNQIQLPTDFQAAPVNFDTLDNSGTDWENYDQWWL